MVKQGAGVFAGGVAMYLLAPARSIFTDMTPGFSTQAYWTERTSISAALAFMVALGARAALSARGKWLGVSSMGVVAVLAYVSVPFLGGLINAGVGDAYFVVLLLFYVGSAWIALILGWTHGVWTRRLYYRARIDKDSLERTRYGL